MSGFYLMHRGWQNHPVFRKEAFSRRDAFVWMIEEAAFSERRVGTGQGIVTLTRGQFSHSIRFMAQAWGWEQTKVARFLKALVVEKMLTITTATATATAQKVVTVCNYEKYQAPERVPATAIAVATPQQRHSSATNKKEGKEGNNVDDARERDPFGEIGTATATCLNAAGIAITPSQPNKLADQRAIVADWIKAGLSINDDVIPALQRDVTENPDAKRYSLAYFAPAFARIIAKRQSGGGASDRDRQFAAMLEQGKRYGSARQVTRETGE